MTVGFDVFDRWFWCFWQEVLMILTGGFDGFDSRFWWFWCFDSRFWWFWQVVFVFEGCIINDSRFWCFWWFWQVVLMVLMVLMFDSRFWCFWWYRQKVFVFEGCILNHVIMTVGFVLWRRCYQEIPLPPIAAYLGLCCEKLWSASPTNICFLKQKLIVYRIVY